MLLVQQNVLKNCVKALIEKKMNSIHVSVKAIAIILLMFFTHFSHAKDDVKNSQSDITQKSGVNEKTYKANDDIEKESISNHVDIGASNYLQMLLGLFFIVAFIFSIAWLIKRMGTLSPSHSSNLKIIAGLNVGQREKIIVVQIMDEQILVGVTQSNIQLLSKLENNIPSQPYSAAGGFQDKLTSAMQGFKKKTSGDK